MCIVFLYIITLFQKEDNNFTNSVLKHDIKVYEQRRLGHMTVCRLTIYDKTVHSLRLALFILLLYTTCVTFVKR